MLQFRDIKLQLQEVTSSFFIWARKSLHFLQIIVRHNIEIMRNNCNCEIKLQLWDMLQFPRYKAAITRNYK